MDKRGVLVLKSRGVEQFVGAEPAFSAIRAAHPDDSIDLMTSHELGRLAKGAPYFDRVLARNDVTNQQARARFTAQLKKMRHHTIYDLDGSQETLLLRKKLGGFRGAKWVGPKQVKRAAAGVRKSRAIARTEFPTLAPPAMRKLLDDHGLEIGTRLPDMSWILSSHRETANMRPGWYGISGSYALILPSENPATRWPANYYAAFASRLIETGITPVLVGDKGLSELGQEVSFLVVREGPKGGARAMVDLIGKTDLAQLAALAASADFFLSGATDELSLLLSVGCAGVVMMNDNDYLSEMALKGRNAVRVGGGDVQNYHPEDAVNLLANMGMIKREQLIGDNVMRAGAGTGAGTGAGREIIAE